MFLLTNSRLMKATAIRSLAEMTTGLEKSARTEANARLLLMRAYSSHPVAASATLSTPVRAAADRMPLHPVGATRVTVPFEGILPTNHSRRRKRRAPHFNRYAQNETHHIRR